MQLISGFHLHIINYVSGNCESAILSKSSVKSPSTQTVDEGYIDIQYVSSFQFVDLSNHCWDLNSVVLLKFRQETFLVLQRHDSRPFPAFSVLSLPFSDGI